MRRSDRGMILEQMVISVAVLLMLAPVINLILFLQLRMTAFDEEIQDEIALAQLRRILNVSEDIRSSGSHLTFRYHDEPQQLYTVNDHLILTPGTKIFLSQIDSASFRISGHETLITYTRNGHEETRVLAWR